MMTLSRPREEAAAAPEARDSPGDDAEMVRRALAGEALAFDQIVRAYHRRVFQFLFQMTRQRQDAEDLTQQTFLKAFHHLAGFDLQRPLINWLLTIARRSALNHFRDTRKWEELPPDTASPAPSPARQAEDLERTEQLWDRARAILAPRAFEILWLRFGEDLSIEETAQVVGLTQTHVKVLVFRARQLLLKGTHFP